MSSVGALDELDAAAALGLLESESLEVVDEDDSDDDEEELLLSEDDPEELEGAAMSGEEREVTSTTSVIKNANFFMMKSFSPLPLR